MANPIFKIRFPVYINEKYRKNFRKTIMVQISDRLYCVKVTDFSGNPDLSFELLGALEADFSSYEDRETGAIHFTAYAETPGDQAALAARIAANLADWRALDVNFSDVECFELKKEEWSEVWKKYFHILPIADNLVIRPSWLEYRPKPGQAVVDIDPGMSFGTGQHATTAYCLRVLARHAGQPQYRRLLDAGTGSGILALAGAKLGYQPIDAFDYDPDAVQVARENAALNRLPPGAVRFFTADATAFEAAECYDLAAVNILCPILRAHAPRIVSWVRPGGLLALAGILSGDFDALSHDFAAAGADELERFTEKEWTSGLFRRRNTV